MSATQTNYADMVKDIQSAIKSDINTVNKWQTVGNEVSGFFGSESALLEVKAQFIADAIIPALNKTHQEALAKDLPRKGSKEYNEHASTNANYVELWKDANDAKKDARATAHTYFNRIVSYAFPKEPSESEGSTVSDTTKDIELLNGLIKRLEKAESRPYDLAQVINNLKVTLALIHE
jgi:phosphoenolpyruvate carboxylase